MNALANNKKQITNFLINQSDWVSSTELSLRTAIAERKIKYAINRINLEYGNIIQSSKKGYLIKTKDIDQAKQIFEGEKEAPGNYEERKKAILIKLLMGKQELNIDDLTHSLFISKNVLLNELSRIRKELKPYHITIQTRKDVITLTGESADKKKLILDYLNMELETSFFCVDNIQAFFEGIDLYALKDIILTALSEYGYYIDNYSLINYIINLALLVLFGKSRINVIEDPELPKTTHDSIPAPIREIVDNIYERTKEAYDGYTFSKKGFYEISIEILTRLVPNAIDSMKIDDADGILGDDIKVVMDQIFKSVYKTYAIDLRSEIFFTRFSYHIKNLIARMEQDIDVNMHMSSSIKRTYPMVFAIAVHIARLIRPEKNCSISEEEIALIALYVGTIIEEKKGLDEKLSCIIITPDYYVVRESIIKNFRDVLGKYIYIRDIISDMNEITTLNDYDLVLSTIPLDITFSIPFLQINPIMSDEDIKNILSYVDVVKKIKEKKLIRNKISHFFHEDIFFTDTSFTTSHEVIEYVCDLMVSKHYADSNFKQKIYQHEEIGSSDYGVVAITHPLDNDCNYSAISVLIQKDPIKWGRNDVNIVFIFSLRDIDGDLFKDVFGLILDLITDKQHFDKLLEIKDFNQFVNMILENR
jgi:lichenan operon transcriptional antiterminator